MTTCDTGCVIRNHHTDNCTTPTCRGCTPRPTFIGRLCAWCWQRLNADIAEIPTLVQHLHYMGYPYPKGWSPKDDITTSGDPAEMNALPAEWLAADELTRLLDSWIDFLMEQHPDRLLGPQGTGLHPAQWVTPWLEWVANQDWAHEMRAEISRDVSTFKARWPTADMIERERGIPDIRCPRCNQVSLTYTPPTEYKQPFKVGCSNPDCARVFSEDEWERLVALVARVDQGVPA